PPVKYDDSHVDPNNLWRRKSKVTDNQYGMHEDEERDKRLFREGKFQILRKSPATILAMRRPVYDNAHQPRDLANDPRFTRWPVEGSGWKVLNKTSFQHGGQGQEVDWLRYRHIPRNSPDQKKQLITDFLGYNAFVANRPDRNQADWDQPEPYN